MKLDFISWKNKLSLACLKGRPKNKSIMTWNQGWSHWSNCKAFNFLSDKSPSHRQCAKRTDSNKQHGSKKPKKIKTLVNTKLIRLLREKIILIIRILMNPVQDVKRWLEKAKIILIWLLLKMIYWLEIVEKLHPNLFQ